MVYMKPDHEDKLLYKFPIRIIILFEYELINWQKNLDVYSLNINKSHILNCMKFLRNMYKAHLF